MEQKDELTEHESLQIIQQMIDTAKQEQKDDGKGWIIWGWMLFLASVLTAINMHYRWFQTFFFWNVLGIVTLVIFIVEIIKNFTVKKLQKVETYTRAIFKKLNIGFFICLFFIIIAMNVGINPLKGFPLLISLYGFWILIYGAILDFKPSVIGAFVTWVLAFVALFQSSFQVIMMLHAAAALCGYIIPGHIANKKFKEVSGRKFINKRSGV
jgi:MFS family permease